MILISSCLLGAKVRYHGGDAHCRHPLLERWISERRLISICPEILGGAPTPRAPSEIIGVGAGLSVLKNVAKIKNKEGSDVTSTYVKGAHIVLEKVRKNNIKMAILKDNSPSCGSHLIYDGTFTNQKILGMGIAATLLDQYGIKLFTENQLAEADNYLCTIEAN
ncbi:MAG: DUF523 domain-containing protein [Gammaproteobacteria bacterium]